MQELDRKRRSSDVTGVPLSKKASAFSIDALLADKEKSLKKESCPSPHSEVSSPLSITEQADSPGSTFSSPVKSPAVRSPSTHSAHSPTIQTIKLESSPKLAECVLETQDLWSRFHELGTEMIITKSGRRMFPTMRVSFGGLNPGKRYQVILEVRPTDSKRYRYAYHRSCWLVAGKADPAPPRRLYVHPDGPFTSEQLERQPISFEKIKLTNNHTQAPGHIILHSMHKYQPHIFLVPVDDNTTELLTGDVTGTALDQCDSMRQYVFPETAFIAVTAYQNQLITKLKIDSNPFAKGFRDSSRLGDFDRDGSTSFSDTLVCSESLLRPNDDLRHAWLAAAGLRPPSHTIRSQMNATWSLHQQQLVSAGLGSTGKVFAAQDYAALLRSAQLYPCFPMLPPPS